MRYSQTKKTIEELEQELEVQRLELLEATQAWYRAQNIIARMKDNKEKDEIANAIIDSIKGGRTL